MMPAASPPGLHVAGESPDSAGAGPQPVSEDQTFAGDGLGPASSGGLWPLVALTALELTFVVVLVSLGRGCAQDAVRAAAETSAVAGALFYAPRTLTVIGRRLFGAPSEGATRR